MPISFINNIDSFGHFHKHFVKTHCPGLLSSTIVKGKLKGEASVPMTSCLTGFDKSILQIKTKIVSTHTADSKPVKHEVNDTVIPSPLVSPALSIACMLPCCVFKMH